MRRIADVEQQTVATARSARSANCRIQSDVVTLTRARLGTRRCRGCIRPEHLGDNGGEIATQRRAIRGRWSARSAARGNDALQLLGNEKVGRDLFLPKKYRRVGSARLRVFYLLLVLGDVNRGFTVMRWSHESAENPRRGDDRRLLRMSQRHLDHFDAEQRRSSDPCPE